MSQKILGAGVIGAGAIFKDHARAYTQLGSRVRLVGLADVDANRARKSAKDFFVPFVTDDYHALLARDDIDLVSICTPPSLHERMVVDALEAGKYVLCEKPLAHNLASADRILEASREHPNRLSVVYQKRYSNEVLRSKWLVEQGHLGPLQSGRFSRVSYIPFQHRSSGSWWGKWDVAGGGALITQCIHEVDIQLQLFGPAKRVTATMATLASPIESEDTLSAMVEHESGAIVSVSCVVGHTVGSKMQWDAVGPEAAIHFPWFVNTTDRQKRNQMQRDVQQRYPGGQQKSLLPGPLGKVTRMVKRKLGIGQRQVPSEHKPYIAAVLDAIAAGGPLPISAEEARQSLELCMAAYTSAITGEPVELPLGEGATFYEGITTDDYQGGRKLEVCEVQP